MTCPVFGVHYNGLIKNAEDAQSWRDYHRERVEYLRTQTDLPPRALEAALRGQEKFENYLLEKGYVRSPGGEVRELTLAYFKKLLPVNFLVKFASMRLPAGGTTAVPTVG
jgi:hypothetical protein